MDREDFDQTAMPSLIRVFAGHTGDFVGFVMRRLMSCLKSKTLSRNACFYLRGKAFLLDFPKKLCQC